ncbi:hypothetical protein HK098_005443 [Nowakowskiella sp. JEL0407]|nr:hypothetical protein HK098_005443 [Nowakowskiella sp. JEL0407]
MGETTVTPLPKINLFPDIECVNAFVGVLRTLSSQKVVVSFGKEDSIFVHFGSIEESCYAALIVLFPKLPTLERATIKFDDCDMDIHDIEFDEVEEIPDEDYCSDSLNLNQFFVDLTVSICNNDKTSVVELTVRHDNIFCNVRLLENLLDRIKQEDRMHFAGFKQSIVLDSWNFVRIGRTYCRDLKLRIFVTMEDMENIMEKHQLK